ncbi:uncharacterized protein I206_102468 [Kwoniella pini CBS 10737]|uniref:EKC/KEOPS complex subunit CGI121 n=1 Tax=Kwoniella pini CBS 10737 TaxID=1296096 RepID=A0A1B9I5G0_9TREE|nr:uncharacterized protein I206_02819 [Kwoniella pini CBS 10737]OCF50763.1 hypothetical protein I206_02819 [Kwoniella pini CBS 10737]
METYTLPSFPSEYSTIHICLFENVTNSSEIKKRLIEAATTEGEEGERLRKEVDYGFIEADILVSKEHLLTSIMTTLLYAFPSTSNANDSSKDLNLNLNKLTITNEKNNDNVNEIKLKPKTRTHNLHSEILLSLSPNNNITDSIKRFGLSEKTKNLIIIKFTNNDFKELQKQKQKQKIIYENIQNLVKGNLINLNEIEKITNWQKVDKIYKLSELNSIKSHDLISKKRSAVISTVGVKNVI